MCKVVGVPGSRRAVRFALAGFTAALLAGCADSRSIIGDPLGNPFKTASTDPTPTASYDRDMAPPPPYQPRRASAVESRPLAAPSSSPSSRRVASYDAPAHPSPKLAPSYAAPRTERTASLSAPSGKGGWSAVGGMPVIAAGGETAGILAQRYNVPTDALLRTNGFTSTAQIHAGTRVVIPVYSSTAHPVETAKAEVRKPKEQPARERVIAKHEPKGQEPKKVAAKHEKSEDREIMHWKKGPQPAKTAKAEKLAEKPTKATKTAAAVKPTTAKKSITEEAPAQVAKAEAPAKSRAVDPTPTASLPAAPEKAVASASGAPEFRWPAHGRIIQGFKSAGNDGINIAVPEGTSIKAAESGTVAYAGNEIKGFGNLVLIRHPNGFVTAYANNGSLDVRRGEQVKRGQVIAKSGQTGNVASPQLHFEVRKGSTPVDPTRFLAGAGA